MRKYLVLLLIVLLVGTALFFFAPKSHPAGDSLRAYKEGLGVYAPIPQNSGVVSSSVESACTFLSARSSVNFSQDFKNRLIDLEASSLTGTKPDLEKVFQILSDQLFETIGSLTDSEIDSMIPVWKTLPDFTHENRSPYVNLRRDGRAILESEFSAIAKEFRDGQTIQSLVWRAMFPDQVRDEIKLRADCYARALPTQWGGDYYTPLQVILLAYSLVSDDYLDGDIDYLNRHMSANSGYLQSAYAINSPITGRKAFGHNGYLNSSPVNLLFTEQVANRILDRLQEVLQ